MARRAATQQVVKPMRVRTRPAGDVVDVLDASIADIRPGFTRAL
jgi:hypothetical protein